MQLYSLKDSDIIELLEAGVDINTVKEAAGHTSIATTNEYLKHHNERMITSVREAGVTL